MVPTRQRSLAGRRATAEASSDAKHAGVGESGAAKGKRREASQEGLKDRIVPFQFVVGDLGAVGVPLDLFIFDQFRKNMVAEGAADKGA